MGFLMVIFLSFCYVSFGPKTANAATFDVTSYGAIGDGNTDDTESFVKAWADLCEDTSQDPTLIIPSSKIFLLGPMAFNGPCKSTTTVTIQLLGNITAPTTMDGWKDCPQKNYWIYFNSVEGLVIDGSGQIDGQGSIWWGQESKSETCERPSALRFHNCNGLRLNGTTHINSPKLHMSINGCQDVDIGNLLIIAPGDSPNTDGIDISDSSHVNIHNSSIQTGDDCVAINGGVVDLNVTGVSCGPGHGISIGSLGENGSHDTVEQVHILNCTISGTTNRLRIKTLPGGTGYAKGIVYQNINLIDVKKPIIIDQHYCDNLEDEYCPAPPEAPAVQVSDITYTNVTGSCASKQAITFDCSVKFNCTDIVTNQVEISGDDPVSYCVDTEGSFDSTTPSVSCSY